MRRDGLSTGGFRALGAFPIFQNLDRTGSEHIMRILLVTERCIWCGRIRSQQEWRLERRQPPGPYSYTSCKECRSIEAEFLCGGTHKTGAPHFHGKHGGLTDWGLRLG
jgi:hypothetical protein